MISATRESALPSGVSAKLGIRRGIRAAFVGAPADILATIKPVGADLVSDPTGELDYIHVFVVSTEELENAFEKLRSHLAPGGMLWVSWPKGGRLSSDLRLPQVIEIGYRHNLVESKCISIDTTWSALKFTHPKTGKTYRNSYGKLPSSSVPADHGPRPSGS